MRKEDKIKGILATCGLTYDEYAHLVGVTRKTIYQYLNHADMEDTDKGLVALDIANTLLNLAREGVLPLDRGVSKEEKVSRIKTLLT